jgi:hypothetical protein
MENKELQEESIINGGSHSPSYTSSSTVKPNKGRISQLSHSRIPFSNYYSEEELINLKFFYEM